jgi:hypothetical protein
VAPTHVMPIIRPAGNGRRVGNGGMAPIGQRRINFLPSTLARDVGVIKRVPQK